MKMKNVDLKWYVLNYDCNKRCVIAYNVMTGIAELVAKEVRKRKYF